MIIFKDNVDPMYVDYKDVSHVLELMKYLKCDICGKEYFESDLKGDDVHKYYDAQEFEFIRHFGGYGADHDNTVFYDDCRCMVDICQHCLSNLIGKYMTIRKV